MSTILESLTTIDAELNRLKSPASLKKSNKAESARSNLNTLAQKYMSNLDPRTGNAIMVQFVGDSLKFFKILRHSQAVRRDYLDGLNLNLMLLEPIQSYGGSSKSADQIGDITAVMQDIGFKSVESAYLLRPREKGDRRMATDRNKIIVLSIALAVSSNAVADNADHCVSIVDSKERLECTTEPCALQNLQTKKKQIHLPQEHGYERRIQSERHRKKGHGKTNLGASRCLKRGVAPEG